MSVKDIDHRWKEIKRDLAELKGAYTKVGLQQGSTHTDPKSSEMSDLVTIGAVHEFGTRRIPQRSWLRTAFDSNLQSINSLKMQLVNKVVENKLTPVGALRILGEFFESKVKANIEAIKDPPNAPSTIKRKGSSNPLIDTGQMLQSVRHVEVM